MCVRRLTYWTSSLNNSPLQRAGCFIFEIMGLAGCCSSRPLSSTVTETHCTLLAQEKVRILRAGLERWRSSEEEHSMLLEKPGLVPSTHTAQLSL